MNKLVLLAIGLILTLQGCQGCNDPETKCMPPGPPPLNSVRLAVVDDTTGEDMLSSGAIAFGDIKVVTLCNGNEVQFESIIVQRNGQPLKMLIITDAIPPIANEQTCDGLAITWSNTDTDTIKFGSTSQNCGDCCINYYSYLIIKGDTVQPNGSSWGEYECNTCFTIKK